MGSQATYAIIDENHKVTATSVGNSRHIDENIKEALTGNAEIDAATLKQMFEDITQYEHVTCVEPAEEFVEAYNGHYHITNTAGNFNILQRTTFNIMYGAVDDVTKRVMNAGNQQEAFEYVRSFHATQDGLSAVYDVNRPDHVSFIYHSAPNVITTEHIPLVDIFNGELTDYLKVRG